MNRQKFWTYTKPAANGCIEWTGCRDKNGYGKLKLDGAGMLAHRAAWLILRGGTDKHLHHRCENPSCVNVEHLEPMEHGEHVKHHKPLCRRGHPESERKPRADGHGLECRACQRERSRKRIESRKVPCANCGAPHLHPRDGNRATYTGLCSRCWLNRNRLPNEWRIEEAA